MPVVLKMLLAFGVGIICMILINIPDTIRQIRKENKKFKRDGCHCAKLRFGGIQISPECPVHKDQCTISHYKDFYGKGYVEFPYTEVERIMLCQECFDKLSEEKIEMFYYRSIGACGVCGKKRQVCIRVPTNLVDDWLTGRTFHFSHNRKGEDDASRRDQDTDSSAP